VSRLSTGKVEYDLPTGMRVPNSLVWLGNTAQGRRLAVGCNEGSIIIWSLNSNGHYKEKHLTDFHEEIVLLDYERSSEQLLVIFYRSIALLNTRDDPSVDVASCRKMEYDDDIGGAGFLGTDYSGGSRCVVTLRKKRQL
jgi:hypothetical protein